MAGRTAWRICSSLGWWSAFGKKRCKNGKTPGRPVHDDLCAVTDDKGRVRHEFTAAGPNELWLADITEHWTGEGKLYVCAIKDVYSNRIVGYSIDSRMKSRLAVAALNHAVARRHVAWDEDPTYLRRPPYLDGMTREHAPVQNITGAQCW